MIHKTERFNAAPLGTVHLVQFAPGGECKYLDIIHIGGISADTDGEILGAAIFKNKFNRARALYLHGLRASGRADGQLADALAFCQEPYMGVFSRGTCHTVPNILEDTCAARDLGLPGLSSPDHTAAA